MPLPLILGAAAVAAAGFGAKKGYDGYQDKTEANEIIEKAKSDYESTKSRFDEANEITEEHLTNLGELQLKVGSDFKKFRTIAQELLDKLEKSNVGDIAVDFPKHKLDQIDGLAFSTTAYLGELAKGAVGGGAAAYAVYGGVMALAAASTGTPIAALSGAAAYNATMAAIGGGALSAGGMGMAGGAMVLGGVVAAPIIAIAGWAFASHAEEALSDAKESRREVGQAIAKMQKAQHQLGQTRIYVKKLHIEIERIYTTIFLPYFDALKKMEIVIKSGENREEITDELIQIIGNGYQVAAILTDIITTPLFKPKMDGNGKVLMSKDNVVEIEVNADGLQVINANQIDANLATSNKASQKY
ncbi:chemotaxis protein [Vibrio coralliirubri]|uniref:chemotaxis protein n=1 Tax=Vibrio coralliirubri TaxID=1516159 RepID=UPI002FE21330